MQQHDGLVVSSEQKPGCKTKRNDAHQLYKGWLSVERSMYPEFESYVTEHLQVFSGGWLEVRKFRWSQPVEVIWSTEKRCYLLSMALDGQETATVVTDMKTGQRRELDPKARMQAHSPPPFGARPDSYPAKSRRAKKPAPVRSRRQKEWPS